MKKLLILVFILTLSAVLVSCADTQSDNNPVQTTPEPLQGDRTVSHFGITCELPEGFAKDDEATDHVTYRNAETSSTIDFAIFDKGAVPSSLTKSNVDEWFAPEDLESILSVEEMLFDWYDCSRVKMEETIDGVIIYSEQTVVFFDDHVAFLTVSAPESSDFRGQFDAFYDTVHMG